MTLADRLVLVGLKVGPMLPGFSLVLTRPP
jgi:hypothetical protein